MPLYICSLNSGSNGNCYYVGNSQEAVLIDAGISCRETEKRMLRAGLSMNSVKAIFISHEHADHITGIPGISKKYALPVYITPGTHAKLDVPVDPALTRVLSPSQAVSIGQLEVIAFPKFHDAADPHSFVIKQGHVQVGVFTDIGKACSNVIGHFKKCQAVFLESNYCPQMLEDGRYPFFLKERIRNGHGHLSNQEALTLFTKHRGKQLSHLLLSHLSRNNNSMELVERIFTEKAGKTKIVIASRYKETEVFEIDGRPHQEAKKVEQLRLF
jgi:phosphoribosyl 1,2-cyclic phosphodiesterase